MDQNESLIYHWYFKEIFHAVLLIKIWNPALIENALFADIFLHLYKKEHGI